MAMTTAEHQSIPMPRRARQPKVALPGQVAPNQMGSGYVDPVAWQKEQDRLQKRAVDLHEQNKTRERAERRQEELARSRGQNRTLEEVVGGGVREVAPDPDNWQKQVDTGLPMRGPKVDGDGRFLGDGGVPVKKSRKVKGRVAEAKQAAGRVSAARKKVARSVK